MLYHRIISKVEPKDMVRHITNNGNDQIIIGVIGIFDTEVVRWKYYISSFIKTTNAMYLTTELCKSNSVMSPSTITQSCKEVKTIEEGDKLILEFKMKWETGSNDLISEQRDKKLNEILDGNTTNTSV